MNAILSTVKDIQFPQKSYSISVLENQTATATGFNSLLSLWPVSNNFGEIFKFQILNNHPSFMIDEKSGILQLNYSNPLDREVNDKLHLIVQATCVQNDSENTVLFFFKRYI